MDRIEDYQAFVAAVDKGSLTAAARALGRSLQSVSRSLAALERDVGVELVRRTTRRSNPTEAGLALHRRLSAALAEIEAARQEAANRRSEPAGLLRITCSTAFAALYLVPVAADFLAAHPGIAVELHNSDEYVDLVAEGFDLAIRIGELPDSNLRARKLADLRRVVFAAPGYLARRGRPLHPDELRQHDCVLRTASRDGNAWPFRIDRRKRTVRVAGRFRASGALAANEAVLQGLGIGNAPLWQVRAWLERGAVELVLTRFEPAPVPVHAVWPATRVLPAKTQRFIEFLAERLKHALA